MPAVAAIGPEPRQSDEQKYRRGGPDAVHALGHVGLAFAFATPLAVVLAESGLPGSILPATAVFVGLSTLPDVDYHLPGIAHRGGTHSIPFAIAVGLVVAGAAVMGGPVLVSGDAAVLATIGFALGAGAVGLHVLADVLTPMGVAPAWPLSRERRSLGVVRSANGRVNRASFAFGVACWCVVAWITLA